LDGTSSFDVAPSGSGSKVTWSFGYESGTSPLKRWKALMLDGFVGAEYRTGLDRLKEKIESERRPTEPTISVAPEGGESSESEQPADALPPGEAAPAEAQPDAAAPAAAEAAPPAPAPVPKTVKKKRRQ
jgi:hypothetical protein